MANHNYAWQYSVEELILRIVEHHPVVATRKSWEQVYYAMRLPGVGECFDLFKLEHLAMQVESQI